MSKSVQVSKERLEELTGVLHLRALRAMLSKDAHVVPESSIEGNRGRVDKAVRVMLHHRLMYRCAPAEVKQRGYYGPRVVSGYWPTTLMDRVEDYAAKHSPFEFEKAVRGDLEGMGTVSHGGRRDKVSMAGWRAIGSADIPQLAHMWVHRGEYLFMDDSGDGWDPKPHGDPRPWADVDEPKYYATAEGVAAHEKLVLRNIAEIHAKDNFHRLTRPDTGLPGSSDHRELEVQLSNVGYMAPDEGSLGDVDRACGEAVKAIRRYREGCRSLMQAVRHHGGGAGYRIEIMRRAVTDMVDMAPVALAERRGPAAASKRVVFARYLMEHADGMSFGDLFDDRPPVLEAPGESDPYWGHWAAQAPLDRHFREVLDLSEDNPD